jgi:hypothetical protein
MTFPSFSSGEVLRAADMNAVGLWLVKTQTVGTGVSSVTVTDAFSADYYNYFLTYTGGTSSASANIELLIGSATTAYFSSLQFAALGGSTANATGQTNAGFFNWAGHTSSNRQVCAINVYNPFLSKNTSMTSLFDNDTDAGYTYGVLKDTNSYTSFILRASTGTFTGGTIQIYGYKK